MRTALIGLLAVGCFLAPLATAWFRRRRWGMPVRVVTDETVSAADMAAYLAEVARHLDAHPQRLRVDVRHMGRTGGGWTLDVTPARNMVVRRADGDVQTFDVRGRWIPDHPVPLRIGRRMRLYVEPVDGNRFRVRTAPPFVVPPWVWLVCSVAAAVGVVTLSPAILAAALGVAAGCRLVHRL